MLERECTLYRFVWHYTHLLVADLSERQMIQQPVPGINHPTWILGHLIVGADYAAQLLGDEQRCSPGFLQTYGPGSQPTENLWDYLGKEELLSGLANQQERVMELASTVSEKRLGLPQKLLFVDFLPTVGDLVAHLMTTHPCIHLGQLSAWRKMMNLPSVLQI